MQDNDFAKRLFNRLSGADFEEIPVKIEEFVTDFLGIEMLSEYQYQLVKAMSQIYKKETLVSIWGEDYADKRWRQTYKEIIMQLGKGSGKDFSSTVAVAYVCYLLLCLKSPSKYYKSDTIDIINIAINSDQANRVFFQNFLKRIKSCAWFDGKYSVTAGHVHFHGGDPEGPDDKSVHVYSGHSEREAFEGYNTLMVILDEISGFAEAPDDEEEDEDGLDKTSKAIYKMYRASVTSRFKLGKLCLLSWPRHENDFIQKKYNEAVVDKEVVVRNHTFKRDPDLPDGISENELFIEWDEDHIIKYKDNRTFALRRPSWEVNPNKEIDDYGDDFFDDVGDALGRYCCMPSNVTRGFFKNMEKARNTFSRLNGVDGDGIFHPTFLPKDDETTYFLHVDLAQKHDKCAVGMAHIDKWIKYPVPGSKMIEYLPLVVVDAIRWWTPTKEKTIDFKSVIEYVKAVRRRGFNIELVTFDRWNSHDTMMDLNRNGIETELLSVAKKHYDDWLVTMYDGRLVGPHEETLLTEMKELRERKGKVDHPRKGNKDLCDAVCGAIFNAVALTPRDEVFEADAWTLADLRKEVREIDRAALEKEQRFKRDNVIVVPRAPLSEAPESVQRMVDDLLRIV
jgi:hypothetical protein